MNESKLDVAQLQKRDPTAWTALLCSELEAENVVVTAVSAEPLRTLFPHSNSRQVMRYVLTLTDHTDPITFIAKHTNGTEAVFYRDITPRIPSLAPRCWFAHIVGDEGWIVMDDVPNHFPPHKWSSDDVEDVIGDMVSLHTTFHNRAAEMRSYGFPHFIGEREYTWQELRQEQAVYFEEGPAALLSEHAIHSAGQLAPVLLQAANGLSVMRALGGWPGVLGESHLTVAADLLDDPVPILEPLVNLPETLLHGDPHCHHWHLTLFDERRLIDWQQAVVGPGVCDLVSLLEQFDLLYEDGSRWNIQVRSERPATEETIIDSYLLAMRNRLGSSFDARAVRQAIPAARCLYVLTNWLPHFATWFSQMPNKYTWQKVNRMSDEQLTGTIFQPLIGFRPYLAAVFQRFLRAYRTL
jgi:hypothetical protein